MTPDERGPAEDSVAGMLGSLHEQLKRIERMIEPELTAATSVERRLLPAWRQATEGAPASGGDCRRVLPKRLAIGPSWVLPTLEGLLMVGLIAANRRRLNRTSTALRAASVLLTAHLDGQRVVDGSD